MGREIHVRKNEDGSLKYRLYSNNSDIYVSRELNKEQMVERLLFNALDNFMDHDILFNSHQKNSIDYSEMSTQDVFTNYQSQWISESVKECQKVLEKPWDEEINDFGEWTEEEIAQIKKTNMLKRELLIRLADFYLDE